VYASPVLPSVHHTPHFLRLLMPRVTLPWALGPLAGCSVMLECLAFKSTRNRSTQDMITEVGCSVMLECLAFKSTRNSSTQDKITELLSTQCWLQLCGSRTIPGQNLSCASWAVASASVSCCLGSCFCECDLSAWLYCFRASPGQARPGQAKPLVEQTSCNLCFGYYHG